MLEAENNVFKAEDGNPGVRMGATLDSGPLGLKMYSGVRWYLRLKPQK